jgi:exodeoxyribonuclease V alpha subunit
MNDRQKSRSSTGTVRQPTVELIGTVLQTVYAQLDRVSGKTFYIFKFQPDLSCGSQLKSEAIRVPENRKGGVSQYHLRVKLDTTLAVTPKMRISLRGFFQKDPNFGWQFKATTAEADTVKSKQEAILAALGSVKGNNGCPLIGKDRLKKIRQTLGSDIGEILKSEPGRLKEAVPALTEEDIQRLAAAWNASSGDDAEILKKLQQFEGIGATLARAILDEFGSKVLGTIRRDPYLLAKRVPGIGFQTADKIALGLNLPPQARCLALMEHAVREAAAENGDCGKKKEDVIEAGVEISGLEKGMVEQILNASLGQKNSDIIEENGVLWLKSLLLAEEKVANWIGKSLQQPAALSAASGSVADLSSEQSAALREILQAPVSILTGGPGTGKTTLLKAVVQATANCVLCAPTGRAAKRLAEVTDHDAMTLHRLVFRKQNPLTSETLLIVDECSMADVAIMAELAAKCAAKLPRLLFVGDADQLPSVGAGQVFRDLIGCGKIPVHRLTHNFRSAGAGGGIIQAAAAVLAGKVPKPAGFNPDSDFCFIQTDTAEEAADKAVEFATRILPEETGLDSLKEIQVLAPMRVGPAGTQTLNESLRQVLNPAAAASATEEVPFAPGDRVINLQNQPALDIYNGDLGVVSKVDHAKKEATVRFDGNEILFDNKRLRWLTLAYAVTTHKSQGSEYPAVVVVLVKGHYVLLDRNLLYTAMTRAQRHLVVIAQQGALRLSVKDLPRPRLTRLESLLR